jgi:hypothetical protein
VFQCGVFHQSATDVRAAVRANAILGEIENFECAILLDAFAEYSGLLFLKEISWELAQQHFLF